MREHGRNLAQATYITSLKEWHSMLEGPLPVRWARGIETCFPVGLAAQGEHNPPGLLAR